MPFESSSLSTTPQDQVATYSGVTKDIFEANNHSNVKDDAGVIYNEQARLLLLANVLTKDRVLTHNGKAFFKELIIRKDQRLLDIVMHFSGSEGKYVYREGYSYIAFSVIYLLFFAFG